MRQWLLCKLGRHLWLEVETEEGWRYVFCWHCGELDGREISS